jgi:hypothetical protein
MMRHSSGFSSAVATRARAVWWWALTLHGHDRIGLKVEKPAGWIAAAVGGHH